MLRRTIQAICEGRDPGDLTTIDDPASLDQIRQAMEEGRDVRYFLHPAVYEALRQTNL